MTPIKNIFQMSSRRSTVYAPTDFLRSITGEIVVRTRWGNKIRERPTAFIDIFDGVEIVGTDSLEI